MARMRRNLGEWVSGKVGNVVFVTTKNYSYVRAAPVQTKPWSEGQNLHRTRIKNVSALWRSLKTDKMAKIWDLAAIDMNRFPWFVKLNLSAFALNGSLIDPLNMLVSDGRLPLPLTFSAEKSLEDPSSMVLSWENDPNEKATRMSDRILFRTYGEGRFSAIKNSGFTRADLSGVLPISNDLPVVHPSHVFLFFESEEEQKYSPSWGFKI